jgi:hypothetical protein
MTSIQAALEARGSSAQQAEAHSVASQVTALCERSAADGLAVPTAWQCIDDGDSGATLVRPALARRRDLAAGAPWTGSRSTPRIGWRAKTPTKCCWWMSANAPGWRASS